MRYNDYQQDIISDQKAKGAGGVSDYSFSIFPNENFMDLRLYQYGWEKCKPLHSFGPHVRNHYLFHFIIDGQGSLDAVGEDGTRRQYQLSAGQGFLICPGQITTYSAHRQQPWTYAWVELDGLRAAEFLEDAGLSIARPIYDLRDPALAETVQREIMAIADRPDASPIRLIGQLYLLLDCLILSSAARRGVRPGQLQDFYIQEAVTFMEKNYPNGGLTVEEVADVCRLNRSYFSRLFRERMGCPPQEFLIRLRLSRAAEMMTASRASIGSIAASCGYANQLHFSRAFRKHYGISPREWRRRAGGGGGVPPLSHPASAPSGPCPDDKR